MPLSLKEKLEVWAGALRAYDQEDFEEALRLFSRIPKSSIILTNMGLVYAALGDHEAAVERFIAATRRDPYLAVAYFQCGVSNFLMARYEFAYRDFREAMSHLRENQCIDYEQIGLSFQLFSAEVLFNQGLCLINLGQVKKGLEDLEAAREAKATKDHDIIDGAIRRSGRGYTVFSVPRGICYRPSEKKMANAASKDYMGEARLIAAIDLNDTTTGFAGVERLKNPTRTATQTDDERLFMRAMSLDDVTIPNETAKASHLRRSKTTPTKSRGSLNGEMRTSHSPGPRPTPADVPSRVDWNLAGPQLQLILPRTL